MKYREAYAVKRDLNTDEFIGRTDLLQLDDTDIIIEDWKNYDTEPGTKLEVFVTRQDGSTEERVIYPSERERIDPRVTAYMTLQDLRNKYYGIPRWVRLFFSKYRRVIRAISRL